MATRLSSNKQHLILVRHGQSTYNLENRFTGWKDVDLTEKGINEANDAIKLLEDIPIDIAFTSNLKRAQRTLDIILDGLNYDLNVNMDERLNERDYGDLIGQNKAEAAEKFGSEQVQIWRRSYSTPPPGGESLEMTYDRCIPYFKSDILSMLDSKNIIISAHGNSIRAIVKFLLNLSEEEILKTEIGWCEPWIFTFENNHIVDLEIRYKEETNSHLPVDVKKNI
jgi:2,3-bisphosphoglycerate-dependent phosphoglycerate mutase